VINPHANKLSAAAAIWSGADMASVSPVGNVGNVGNPLLLTKKSLAYICGQCGHDPQGSRLAHGERCKFYAVKFHTIFFLLLESNKYMTI
jgi:hypothetical protein